MTDAIIELSDEFIKKIVNEKYGITLNSHEIENCRKSITLIIETTKTMGNCALRPMAELICNSVKDVAELRQFIQAFNIAQSLFGQCKPDGEFYHLCDDPKKSFDSLKSKLKWDNNDPTSFFRIIASRLTRIINNFGTPINGIKAFMIYDDDKKNGEYQIVLQ